jgi:hypothetical protein
MGVGRPHIELLTYRSGMPLLLLSVYASTDQPPSIRASYRLNQLTQRHQHMPPRPPQNV